MLNRSVLAAALVLVGCQGVPEARSGGSDCTTSCGMRVVGAWDTCGQVEKTQEIVFQAMSSIYAVDVACAGVAGSEVRMTGISAAQFELNGVKAYGGYESSLNLVVLPESAWLGYSKLLHELVHLLDYRVAKFEDTEHATFGARQVDNRNADVWDAMQALVGSGEMYRY